MADSPVIPTAQARGVMDADPTAASTSVLDAPGAPAEPAGRKAGFLRGFSSLRYRDYRFLWLGQLGWSGAMWMEVIARNWLVWELTGSGLSLGLANLARALPQVLLALPAGVVADRFNKKYVLQTAQAITLTIYVITCLLILTGKIQLWNLYLFSALLGVSMSFNQPARQAMISRLVPARELMNAVALNQVAMNITRVLGPAAAGALIGFLSVGAAYGVATAVFLIVVVCTMFVPASAGVAKRQMSSARGQMMEGISFVIKNKSILAVMSVALVTFTFVMPYNTLMPVLADAELGIGPSGYALLLSLAGIGALVGGIATAYMGSTKRSGVMFLGGALAFGLCIVTLGAAPVAWMAFLVMPLVGASQSLFMAAGNAALLTRTPQDLQGRVMSLYTLDRGLMPLGSTLGGAVTDMASAPVALVMMGGIATFLVVGVGSLIPSVRKL